MLTPTMPAQDTSTPARPGSTLVALMAVMGMPAPSEMIPSTNRCCRDSFSATASMIDPLGLPPDLRRPHQGQLVHPVEQAGGEGLLVLEAQLLASPERSLDLAPGLLVSGRVGHDHPLF